MIMYLQRYELPPNVSVPSIGSSPLIRHACRYDFLLASRRTLIPLAHFFGIEMGLFRKLGRQVEQFTKTAKTAAEEHVVYQCDNCGARFSEPPKQCPECTSETITQKSTRE